MDLDSVADPGSVAFLTSGSGARNAVFPDPRWIPDTQPILLKARDSFLG